MGAPDAAVLGLGYLGRPLAEKLYQQGRRVAAIKRQGGSITLLGFIFTLHAGQQHPEIRPGHR